MHAFDDEKIAATADIPRSGVPSESADRRDSGRNGPGERPGGESLDGRQDQGSALQPARHPAPVVVWRLDSGRSLSRAWLRPARNPGLDTAVTRQP